MSPAPVLKIIVMICLALINMHQEIMPTFLNIYYVLPHSHPCEMEMDMSIPIF